MRKCAQMRTRCVKCDQLGLKMITVGYPVCTWLCQYIEDPSRWRPALTSAVTTRTAMPDKRNLVILQLYETCPGHRLQHSTETACSQWLLRTQYSIRKLVAADCSTFRQKATTWSITSVATFPELLRSNGTMKQPVMSDKHENICRRALSKVTPGDAFVGYY